MAEDTTLPHGCPQPPKLLAELKFAEGFIDLVVRVLHLDDTEEPARLIVWDGSGDEAESDWALMRALQEQGSLAGTAVPASGIVKEVIMTSCWSVLRDMGFKDGMLTHWCRFRNLAVGIDEPIPGTASAPGRREVLRFREVTSFVLVPEFVPDVQYRLSLAAKMRNTNTTAHDGQPHALAPRAKQHPSQRQNFATDGPVEVTTVIPDHIRNNIPTTPIREIVHSSQTPRKYHCCARVYSIWPSDVEEICKPKPGRNDEFMYSFALTVQEGSDLLNMIVYGTDAVSGCFRSLARQNW